MRRTLQEWSDFLKMYVFMNADGSVYATTNEPKLSTALSPSLRYPLKCVSIFWDFKEEDLIRIDKEAVDFSEFKIINLRPNSNYPQNYHIGWEASLKSPRELDKEIN